MADECGFASKAAAWILSAASLRALLVAVVLVAALQAEAIIVSGNSISSGRRSSTYSTTRRQPQATSASLANNQAVVGTLGVDKEGNVVVKWGNGFAVADSIVLKEYGSEKEFLSAYLEKCESKADKSNDGRILGAAHARKSEFSKIGKKMWAAHLEAVKIANAKAEKEKAAADMARKRLLEGLPLESLFGIKLGKQIDVSAYEKAPNGKAYAFVPEKKFREFGNYAFMTTPSSGLVYQIQAVSSAGTAEERDEEWAFVKKALVKKFKKQEVCEGKDAAGYDLLFPGPGKAGRAIAVRRTWSTISITAIDLDLKKQADEEKAAIDASRLESPDGDLDAL